MNSVTNPSLVEMVQKHPYSSPRCRLFTVSSRTPLLASDPYPDEDDETNERMYYKGGAW